ncbi:hypothetical protein ANAEL_00960 [Anaerolineales bacterium]|nr:hypothetical protein ANAEL_00960 [Anaerolineales bacterium]
MTMIMFLIFLVVVLLLGSKVYIYLRKEQEKIEKPKDQYVQDWDEFTINSTNNKKTKALTQTAKLIEIVTIVASVAWLLLWFYSLSDGVRKISDSIVYGFGLISLTVAFLMFLFLRLRVKGWNLQNALDLFRHPIVYVVLLSLLGGYLLDFYSVPFEIRFKLSQQELEDFAAATYAKHPDGFYAESKTQRVGLFQLYGVEIEGTTVKMISDIWYPIAVYGFAYSPEEKQEQKAWRDSYRRIPFVKNWYYWERTLIE